MNIDVIIYIITNLITIGFIYGTIKTQIKYIEEAINRLNKKQDKYNDVIARTFVCEEKLKEQKERIERIEK